MTPLISVAGLSVQYLVGFRRRPFVAIQGLDLQLQAGEIAGILGPNGSGKTTLLRVLAGLLRPLSGKASLMGLPPGDRQLIQQVGYLPEGPLPFPNMSGPEFLQYLGDLMHLPLERTRSQARRWLSRLDLEDAGSKRIQHYSTGMARRLGLAAALLPDPRILLLDEPTSGLDPEGSLTVMEILREKAAAGGAVLMASHHLQEVEQSCERVYLLVEGRVVAEGRLGELLDSGDRSLVLRSLSAEGMAKVEALVQEAGAEIVYQGPDREHLFALFRRLRRRGSSGAGDREDREEG